MREAMKENFGLIKRPWGVYYIKNKTTGEQTSLKTKEKSEAQRLLQARNDSESQPHFNLALARVYMNGSDPKLGTRTWQEVMEQIVERKTDETRRRWDVAIKDKNFVRSARPISHSPFRHHPNQAMHTARSVSFPSPAATRSPLCARASLVRPAPSKGLVSFCRC